MNKKSQFVKRSIVGGGLTQRTAGETSQQQVEDTFVRQSLSQDSVATPESQNLELKYGKFKGRAGGWIAAVALAVIVIVARVVYAKFCR